MVSALPTKTVDREGKGETMTRRLRGKKAWAIGFVLLGIIWTDRNCQAKGLPSQGFQEVKVERVLRDPRSAQPVVVLSDIKAERGMLIWIGEAEAQALEAARQGVTHRRPLTHDLMLGTLTRLNSRVVQVRITELKEEIFYARILLETPSGQVEMDARPSDAMVLAVKAGCPILVETSLFESRGIPLEVSHTRRYGIEVQELSDDLKEALGYKGEGVLISSVAPGSLAERDGLKREDIVVRAAERPVLETDDLETAISESGEALTLQIFRSGGHHSLTIHPPPR
jgi:bifunctional DNase/RNase